MTHPTNRRRVGMKSRVTLTSIERRLVQMSAQLDRLTASVADLKTVDESASALLAGLSQQLRDAATDPAAINKLADDIDADKAALAKAVADNTPAAAAPAAPAAPDTGSAPPPAA